MTIPWTAILRPLIAETVRAIIARMRAAREKVRRWPPVTRPRPPIVALPVMLCVASLAGCATMGDVALDAAEHEALRVQCDAYYPCAPCPAPPECPSPSPVTPDPGEPPPPPDDGNPSPQPVGPGAGGGAGNCDRDGLAPVGASLWKPQSDGDGKLAFVTGWPLECRGGVTVWYGAKGKRKSERRAWTDGMVRSNGCRYGWRFSRPGGQYGRNVRVVCLDADGGVEREWQIRDGAQRTELRGGGR